MVFNGEKGGLIKKILFVVTEDWYFCSHRIDLAIAARSVGYHIMVATRLSFCKEQLLQQGFEVHHLPFHRSAGRPWNDIYVLFHLIWLFARHKPDLVHHVAMKACLLGSLAACFTRNTAVVNALTGMGYVFTGTGFKQRLLRGLVVPLMRRLFRRKNTWVIVQNPDDLGHLQKLGLVNRDRTRLIRGSGVNTAFYTMADEQITEKVQIVLPGRMLADKGITDFVAAARILKQRDCNARCVLVGPVDYGNPTAISEGQLHDWEREGVIEWHGYQQDMKKIYQESHIVCLPSYREGLPKALLEAAACGRAIVTTDVPGCREIVRHEENGLLVSPGDVQTLAAALQRLVGDSQLRRRMGRNGRDLVVAGFSLEQVNKETLQLYREVLSVP